MKTVWCRAPRLRSRLGYEECAPETSPTIALSTSISSSNKFYSAVFSLYKSDAAALRERMEVFRQVTKTSKHLFLSFLTTFGLKANEHSLGLVDHNLEATVLFEP